MAIRLKSFEIVDHETLRLIKAGIKEILECENCNLWDPEMLTDMWTYSESFSVV